MGAIGALGMIISAGYSFYIYNRVTYGVPMSLSRYGRDINRREHSLLLVIVIIVYGLGIWP